MPEAVVYVFGSRVAFTVKPHSGLDLVVVEKAETAIRRRAIKFVRPDKSFDYL